MAILLFIATSAVIYTMIVTYRRAALAGAPEEGVKRSYLTGFVLMIAFMILAFIVARYGQQGV